MSIPAAIGDSLSELANAAQIIKLVFEAIARTGSMREGLKVLGSNIATFYFTGEDKRAIVEHWKNFISLGVTASTFAAVPFLEFIPIAQAFRSFIQLAMSSGELICINGKISDLEREISFLEEINRFLNSLLDPSKKLSNEQLSALTNNISHKLKKINDDLKKNARFLEVAVDEFKHNLEQTDEENQISGAMKRYDIHLLQIPAEKDLPDFSNSAVRDRLLFGTLFNADRLPVLIQCGNKIYAYGKKPTGILDYTLLLELPTPNSKVLSLDFPHIGKPIKKLRKDQVPQEVFDLIHNNNAHSESVFDYMAAAKGKFTHYVEEYVQIITPLQAKAKMLKDTQDLIFEHRNKNFKIDATQKTQIETDIKKISHQMDDLRCQDWNLIVTSKCPPLAEMQKQRRTFYLVPQNNKTSPTIYFLNKTETGIAEVPAREIKGLKKLINLGSNVAAIEAKINDPSNKRLKKTVVACIKDSDKVQSEIKYNPNNLKDLERNRKNHTLLVMGSLFFLASSVGFLVGGPVGMLIGIAGLVVGGICYHRQIINTIRKVASVAVKVVAKIGSFCMRAANYIKEMFTAPRKIKSNQKRATTAIAKKPQMPNNAVLAKTGKPATNPVVKVTASKSQQDIPKPKLPLTSAVTTKTLQPDTSKPKIVSVTDTTALQLQLKPKLIFDNSPKINQVFSNKKDAPTRLTFFKANLQNKTQETAASRTLTHQEVMKELLRRTKERTLKAENLPTNTAAAIEVSIAKSKFNAFGKLGLAMDHTPKASAILTTAPTPQ